MSDGSALKSGMTVFNGVLTVYWTPSFVGTLNVMRNVSYTGSDNKFTTISHVINIQVTPTTTPNQLSLLFSDDFTSGSLSKWSLLDGTMKLQSAQLNLFQNNTKVVTLSSFDLTGQLGVSWVFNLVSSWTNSRGIVIHVDKLNYYEINLSKSPLTITRYLNGKATVVLQSTNLLQEHASNYYSSYKVFLQYTKDGIVISLAKIGTLANDYIVNAIDNFTNMDVFKNVKLGFYDKSTSSPTQSTFKVLQCQVFNGKLIHTRSGVTYHVDGKNGNDLNDGLTKSTALKTLNTAQYQLLPDDNLLIYDSIYRESLQINREASIDHPITIKAVNQPTTTSTFTTNPYTHSVSIDGSLILDNSKFKKIANSNIYQTTINFSPDVVFQDGVKMSLAMKPVPAKLHNEYFVENYIHPKNSSTTSDDQTMIYVQLDDMFKYDSFGNKVPDNYWNGADFYHYLIGSIFVLKRNILSYNASTNTVGLGYSEPGWPNLSVLTGDSYAIANHVGLFSQVGQFVSKDNVISVSLGTDPTVSQTQLEVPALYNGIKFINGMEGITIQGLMVRKFTSDGIVCLGQCINLQVNNCSAKYNTGSGINFSYSSKILVDGGEFSENYNNGVTYGGAMKDSTIQNTYVHSNFNNGIWVGNSGANLFYGWNILLKSNKVGPHDSEKLHPDNIQFAKVNNITLESNVLFQEGFQNMWMEQNGLVTFKRNVFINGAVGVNHAMNVVMINNVFYQSYLRFAVKDESFVSYSSLVGMESIIDWSDVFNSINDTNSQSLSNILVWSGMNSQLSSKIKSYSSYSLLTTTDKNDIINHINSVINNTSFMSQYKDLVIPLLGNVNVVALPYWNAITKRGLLDKSTGKFTVKTTDLSIIEEVRGLTRAILDELVFDGILDKSLMTFYPRIVSINNNAFINGFLQLPSSSYSLVPYWESDFNYIEQPAAYHIDIWKTIAGPNTVLERSLTNTTLYFTNMTTFDFHLNCNSNITLIDRGTIVGLPYYGQSPDIGAYESNCNNGNIVNPVASSPRPVISTQRSSSPKPVSSRVVSAGSKLADYSIVVYLLIILVISYY